jgi:hypothetical protein
LFEDSERFRSFVSDLVLGQAESKRLGDRYREDSILIEPDTSHFDLERPEVVAKHVEAILSLVQPRVAAKA